ncbi:MAG: DMT family transporter [Alphaproteobacteria bacterium]|nr:DMT family transporter [Alphaproteobacteria bacterium]
MNRLRADLLLLLASFIWGTAFIAQKIANESLAPLSFVGMRFLLSALAISPLAFFEAKKKTKSLSLSDFGICCAIGLCIFTASALQQIGLITTTATNGGFLTSLYIVLVPIAVWLLKREKPTPLVVAACAVSVFGAWLLTGGKSGPLIAGDIFVLFSDAAWALGIVLVPVFLARHARPYLLSFIQFCVSAALGISASLLFENATQADIANALPSILYAGLLSGSVAFTMQVFAQRHAPPAEAAIIMALESVFAALAGILLLGERLTPIAAAGCFFILLGVLLSEAGPAIAERLSQRSNRHQSPRRHNP